MQDPTLAPVSEQVLVVSYAAKSKPDERDSIASQEQAIRAAVEREGRRRIVAGFSDEDASAYTGNRGPGLVQAMAEVERLCHAGHEVELWQVDPDRLARGDGKQAKHLVEYVLDVRRVGARLRAVVGDDAYRADSGLAWAAMRGDRNFEDSRAKSAHVTRGKRAAFERGDFGGGPAPVGLLIMREFDERGRPRHWLGGGR